MAKKIGLALGGGGARGLAHLGILRAFKEARIPIYCISGTSMGSIIGACYAVEPDVKIVEEKIMGIISSSLFATLKMDFFKNHDDSKHSGHSKGFLAKTKSFIINGIIRVIGETKFSYLPEGKLEQFIYALLPDIDISETKLPFSCVATDLTNGREKVFTEGPLRRAVLASSSIPGVFPPVEIDGIYYNDGGSVNNTPVRAVKSLGADIVVACDVKSKIMRWEKPEKANDILNRSNYITGVILNDLNLREADIVISPPVKHIHWTGFDKVDFLVEKGYETAKDNLKLIEETLQGKSIIGRFFEWLQNNNPIAKKDKK